MILKELMILERQELSSSEVKAIAKKIYDMAEADAFDEVEDGRGVVTGDMIHSKARAIVKSLPEKIMIHVNDLIDKEHE